MSDTKGAFTLKEGEREDFFWSLRTSENDKAFALTCV